MNPIQYRATSSSALILAPDLLAAALMGAAVEIAGVTPAFPALGESTRAALRRLRPTYVLLSHDEPCLLDDAFMGPAMMTGARLYVFGTERRLRAVDSVVTRYRLEKIVLPRDVETLRDRLTGASESTRRRPEWTER